MTLNPAFSFHSLDPRVAELAHPLARAAARGDVDADAAYGELRRRMMSASTGDEEIPVPTRTWFDSQIERHLPSRPGAPR